MNVKARKQKSLVLALLLGPASIAAQATDVAYTRLDRYTLARAEPTREQRHPLEAITSIHFSRSIASLGEAFDELLADTGYVLAGPRPQEPYLPGVFLLQRPLPASQRSLGPLTLASALDVLAGEAWEPQVDGLTREVDFSLAQSYAMRREELAEIASALQQQTQETQEMKKCRPDSPGRRIVGRDYQVVEGDSLWALAKRYQLPEWSLWETFVYIRDHYEAADPDHLQIGSTITVPGLDASDEDCTAEEVVGPATPGPAAVAVETKTPGPLHQATEPAPPAKVPDQGTGSETYNLRLEPGSLRSNLIRILNEYGYTLGQWDFGSAEEDIDWKIPKGYSYSLPNDLEAVLRALGRTYRLRAVINELDQTVDFSAARASVGGEGP